MSARGQRALRWVVANMAGELLAYGLFAALAEVLTPEVAPDTPAPATFVAVAMVSMGALEGLILGGAQWLALRGVVRGGAGRFVGATAAAMTVAWAMGVGASYLEPERLPPLAFLLAQAGGGGAILGALLGGAQVGPLRAAGLAPERWWLWSALGWSVGMLGSALFAEILPEGPYTALNTLMSMASGGLTGALFGLVTAPAVARMTSAHASPA